MKNNKGFVASGVLYALLILFLAFVIGLLTLLANRKQILDKLKGDIKTELNDTKKYEVYENGTVIYYNPVTDELCGDYNANNSKTGVKTGCLKWYIFNDSKDNPKVNMILDHNTTAHVNWNSTGSNSEMKEVKNSLENDTKNWNGSPRLITADEIAKIVNNSDFDSSKTDYNEWFYFDSKNQNKIVDSTNPSEYSWLFDNTIGCKGWGCLNEVTDTYAYWTSTPIYGSDSYVWDIDRIGGMGYYPVDTTYLIGIRPVISLEKSELKKNVKKDYDFSYTGNVQTFIAPVSGYYNISAWGAQGGTTSSSAVGGKGAYTTGTIYLEQNEVIYIYVGGAGSTTETSVAQNVAGGYNGGGNTGGQACCGRRYGSGGGATDIRLVGGAWNNDASLKSRIMVAAGGGGAFEGGNTVQLYNAGGYGGALTGGNGTQGTADGDQYCYGEGSTQTSGGKITSNCYYSSSVSGGTVTGAFGIGGQEGGASTGGGGGYYGGSRSGHIASAGGGSSFISGYAGSVAISSSTSLTPKSGCTSGTTDVKCSYHYSGKIFASPVMRAGNETMPNHAGNGSIVGNAGNGYVKITLRDNVIYSYTGSDQKFVVPNTGVYKIELWGARGGNIDGYAGGKGAYTSGLIKLSANTDLYVYVGSKASDTDEKGGYNGGGTILAGQAVFGRSGGGATDVRLVSGAANDFTSLKNRIMVAAGGGGANNRNSATDSYYFGAGKGGSAGGLVGYTGESPDNTHTNPQTNLTYGWNIGTGGTQTSGGYQLHNSVTREDGASITGAFGYAPYNANQSGGGGGYYGGASVGHGGAGGGSSYISGHNGCNSVSMDSTASKITHTGSSTHFSNFEFTKTVMIDGEGYEWSDSKQSYVGMPDFGGKNKMAGNTNDGYAKITYCGVSGNLCN